MRFDRTADGRSVELAATTEALRPIRLCHIPSETEALPDNRDENDTRGRWLPLASKLILY